MTRKKTDIQIMLKAWARSSNINDPYHIDYPHEAPFVKHMPKGEYFEAPPPPLDDDLHIVVDKAVCELKRRDLRRWLVIVAAYRQNLRDHQIGTWLRVSRQSVTDMRVRSENQLESWVCEKVTNFSAP